MITQGKEVWQKLQKKVDELPPGYRSLVRALPKMIAILIVARIIFYPISIYMDKVAKETILQARQEISNIENLETGQLLTEVVVEKTKDSIGYLAYNVKSKKYTQEEVAQYYTQVLKETGWSDLKHEEIKHTWTKEKTYDEYLAKKNGFIFSVTFRPEVNTIEYLNSRELFSEYYLTVSKED